VASEICSLSQAKKELLGLVALLEASSTEAVDEYGAQAYTHAATEVKELADRIRDLE